MTGLDPLTTRPTVGAASAAPTAHSRKHAPGRSGRRRNPAVHGGGLLGLTLGAIGVVFGDIGTSPM